MKAILSVLLLLAMPMLASAGYEWIGLLSGENPQYVLNLDGHTVGAYVLKDGCYWTCYYKDQIDASVGKLSWRKDDPPKEAGPIPFGVVVSQIPKGESYEYKGKKISKDEMVGMLKESGSCWYNKASKVFDDKNIEETRTKYRVTVIGSADEVAPVMADWASAKELDPWRDRVVVVSYEPTDYEVARQGFETGGKPTIYVQAPQIEESQLLVNNKPVVNVYGIVKHRQDSYGGAAEMALVMDRLDPVDRRADPDYDKGKDRDLRFQVLPSFPWAIPAMLLIGAVGFFFLRNRKG